MKSLVIFALCTLLVSAEEKKESTSKVVEKVKASEDLEAQATGRSYNSYHGPPGHGPKKSEYGLVDEYPQSGYGKLSDTGYRKSVEPSAGGYQSGYGGYDNRGPLLPSSYGKSTRDHGSSSYSGSSYGSGIAPIRDSYSKPISDYREPSGYREPSSYPKPASPYAKPASGYGGGYGSGYSGPSPSLPSSYSKPLSGYDSHSKYGGYSKPHSSGSRYSKPASPIRDYSKPSAGYDNPRTYGGYSAPPHSGYGPSSSSAYSPKPYSAPLAPAPKPYSGYSSSGSGYAPPSSHSGYVPPPPPPPSGSGYSAPAHSGYSAPAHSGYSAPAPAPHAGYAPAAPNAYAPPAHNSYAPATSYSGPAPSSGYAPKAPSSYSASSYASKPHSGYYGAAPLSGYAAAPGPIGYAPKAHAGYSSSGYGPAPSIGYGHAPSAGYGAAASAGHAGSGYSPDAYGKAYGTVTQKEYSKTVETYGSSAGQLGSHGNAYGSGLGRRALHADHGLYGGASYGSSYNAAGEREHQPQVHSQDQAIYGGYGHVY